LYHNSISFATRIETGIQQYRGRRKFHADTAYIFSAFLSYGGIEASPKQFSGGLSKKDLDERDAAEIAAMAATHIVPEAVQDDMKWEVDFAAVAKGFL